MITPSNRDAPAALAAGAGRPSRSSPPDPLDRHRHDAACGPARYHELVQIVEASRRLVAWLELAGLNQSARVIRREIRRAWGELAGDGEFIPVGRLP